MPKLFIKKIPNSTKCPICPSHENIPKVAQNVQNQKNVQIHELKRHIFQKIPKFYKNAQFIKSAQNVKSQKKNRPKCTKIPRAFEKSTLDGVHGLTKISLKNILLLLHNDRCTNIDTAAGYSTTTTWK